MQEDMKKMTLNERKADSKATELQLNTQPGSQMEETAGGVPYESLNENTYRPEDCRFGGKHEYYYTGNERPGAIISFWPDREMVCIKCLKKIWSRI